MYTIQIKNQAPNKKYRNCASLVNGNPISMKECAENLLSNPVRHILRYLWTPESQRIFNCLIRYFNKYSHLKVNPSIDIIARDAKCSEKTVDRWLPIFKSLGLIDYSNQFNYEKMRYFSNTYVLNPIFQNEMIRKCLGSIFYCLKYLPVALLLASNPALDRYSDKSVPILFFKGININEVNNLSNTRTRAQESKSELKLQPECARLKKIEEGVNNPQGYGVITCKNSYEFLSDEARYIAVLCRLSPASAAYLTGVKSEHLHTASKLYYLAQRKQNPRDKAKLFGSILLKVLAKNNDTIDYALATSIVHHFELDRSWTRLSQQEQSIFLAQMKGISSKLELGVKEELNKKDPEREKKRLDEEQRKFNEQLARNRKNPYSVNYTGPFPYGPNDNPRIKSATSELRIQPTPPTPSSAPAIKCNSQLLGSGTIHDMPDNLMEMLDNATKFHNTHLQPEIIMQIREQFDDQKAVDIFKHYMTVLLPASVETFKKLGCFKQSIFTDMVKRQFDALTPHDQLKLKSQGFLCEFKDPDIDNVISKEQPKE